MSLCQVDANIKKKSHFPQLIQFNSWQWPFQQPYSAIPSTLKSKNFQLISKRRWIINRNDKGINNDWSGKCVERGELWCMKMHDYSWMINDE